MNKLAAITMATVAMMACTIDPHDEACSPAATGVTGSCAPSVSCAITTAKIGGWMNIDIASTCDGSSWSLEHRLLSSGVISVSQHDRPCGSITHVAVLLSSPALADMKAVAWLSDGERRVDCRVD